MPLPPSSPTPPTPQPPPGTQPLSSDSGKPTAGVPSGSPAGGTPGQSAIPRGFERRPAQPTMHPRRVVGGVKLQTRGLAKTDESQGPPAPSVHWTWASARLLRIAEQYAPGEQLSEGLEYARAGQTRQIDMTPGSVMARVQGRMPQAYRVQLRMPTFAPEQWDAITGSMAGQAKYAASLLGGELPSNIEDLFAPSGLSLFPVDLSDLSCACDCDIFRRQAAAPVKKGEAPSLRLCKHICCTMFLVAERLAQQPLLIFALRGLAETDLLERLRTHRAIAGLQRSGGSAAPVYTPHLPVSVRQDMALDQSADTFWSIPEGVSLSDVDMPIEPAAVTHPLLRRMGTSPLGGAKFPLVGLLATCYDVVSEKVIEINNSNAPGTT